MTLAYIHSLPMDPMRIGEISEELYADGEASLTHLAEELRDQGLVVYTEVQLGFPVDRLKSIIQKQPIDLIVMGCQGEHFLPEKVFGSTTTGMLEEVTIPILAVPNGYSPSFPQHIMWATDRRPVVSAETMYPLFELVDRATTKLLVFHYQQNGQALPEKRFRELLADVRYDFFTQLKDGDSVDGAIREFVRTTGADLIALIHRRSTWLSKMIVPSTARRTVWTSPVPVLVLQEKQSL